MVYDRLDPSESAVRFAQALSTATLMGVEVVFQWCVSSNIFWVSSSQSLCFFFVRSQHKSSQWNWGLKMVLICVIPPKWMEWGLLGATHVNRFGAWWQPGFLFGYSKASLRNGAISVSTLNIRKTTANPPWFRFDGDAYNSEEKKMLDHHLKKE